MSKQGTVYEHQTAGLLSEDVGEHVRVLVLVLILLLGYWELMLVQTYSHECS